MNHRLIHLNQLYPLDTDPVLEVFQPTYFDFERKQQPLTRAMVVLPGGGYSFCSHREADPIACRFVSEDIVPLSFGIAPADSSRLRI